MRNVQEIIAKSILTPQKVGSLEGAFDYSLNPYAGCAFACSYCYVPKFPNARHEVKEWGDWLEVKTNAPELIAKDRLKVFGSRIFFSSATDPYQYLELKYRLTRKCLQELLKYQPAKLTLHTRSHLILQDIDLLKEFGDRLNVGFSFTTNDDHVRRAFEPKAPSISRRLATITTLREQGIRVYASLAPLLPCDPDKLIEMLEPHVVGAWVDRMNWPDVNRSPELKEQFASFFNEANYEQTINYLQSALSRPRSNSLRSRSRSFIRQKPKQVIQQMSLFTS